MDKSKDTLNSLREKNPYKVPIGYFDNLSGKIMDNISVQEIQQPRTISLSERIRPWIYLAAVFVGLLLFFRVFIGITTTGKENLDGNSLYVQAAVPEESIKDLSDEDQDFLDYLESGYIQTLITEEFESIE